MPLCVWYYASCKHIPTDTQVAYQKLSNIRKADETVIYNVKEMKCLRY